MFIIIKKLKKTVVLFILFSIVPITSFSQNTKDETLTKTFWDKVQYGGGVGLNFGNTLFSATLAPNAIYPLNPYVSVGAGLNFSYSAQRDVFKSTILGGSIIGLVNPYETIQLSVEFEQLHVSQNFEENFSAIADRNYWYSGLFLGAGYRTNNIVFGIRYDVLYNENTSVYSQPWMPFVRFWF